MDENEHDITEQDINRAAAEPTGAQAGRIEALARAANRAASMKGSAIPMTTGRVLVDDVKPYAVDVTGLTEFRVTRLDHPEGWLAVFAVDERAARVAADDRLTPDDPYWFLDVGTSPRFTPANYPLGELERWVITEPTRTEDRS